MSLEGILYAVIISLVIINLVSLRWASILKLKKEYWKKKLNEQEKWAKSVNKSNEGELRLMKIANKTLSENLSDSRDKITIQINRREKAEKNLARCKSREMKAKVDGTPVIKPVKKSNFRVKLEEKRNEEIRRNMDESSDTVSEEQ